VPFSPSTSCVLSASGRVSESTHDPSDFPAERQRQTNGPGPLVRPSPAAKLERQAVLNAAPRYSRLRQGIGLVCWLAVAFAAAAVGGLASVQAGSFYLDLLRPPWAPPAWLFGPVWSVLYVLMGVAAWLVWREGWRIEVRRALALFVAQLVTNALWTWLFFAWRLGGLAFAEVLLLWVMIAATIYFFARINKLAAALLAPYLAWVSFAAALNFTLWQRNPSILG